MMNWLELFVGAVLGCFIAHFYYRKSARDMKEAQAEQMAMLKASYDAQLEGVQGAREAAAADLWDRRLQRAIEEHRRRGTAQPLIEGFTDYTSDQKSALWDAIGKTIRGPSGFRTNPFR